MEPASPLPAIASLFIAYATGFLLTKKFGAPPAQGRYSSIDGLRGYLAILVFLHHGCMWYFYLRTGHWGVPPYNLYTNLGESGVSLFFMITGFLFFSKLLDGRTTGTDWLRLYVSRFLRLAPLYLFFVALFFLLVAYLSGGVLNEPLPLLLSGLMQWLGFRIFGAPVLNGVEHVVKEVAGMTWTLVFEWGFYAVLPLLALTVRVRLPIRYIALVLFLVIAGFVGLATIQPQVALVLPFFSGITAAILVRSDSFRRFAVRKRSSVIAIGCFGVAVTVFTNAYDAPSLALLSATFMLVASGNTLFGFLVNPVSRTLGQYSYSIYLLHSIILFAVFNFVVGLPESRALSPLSHWLIVMAMTPLVIGICFVTFRYIEHPAMQSVTEVTAWLRARRTKYRLLFEGGQTRG